MNILNEVVIIKKQAIKMQNIFYQNGMYLEVAMNLDSNKTILEESEALEINRCRQGF